MLLEKARQQADATTEVEHFAGKIARKHASEVARFVFGEICGIFTGDRNRFIKDLLVISGKLIKVHATHLIFSCDAGASRLRASIMRWMPRLRDRKSTRLNSSHRCISYAVFC